MAKKSNSPDASHGKFIEYLQALEGMGMTQSEIASELGVTKGHLSRMKNGERPSTKEHIQSLKRIVRQRDLIRRRDSLPVVGMTRVTPFDLDDRILSQLAIKEAVGTFRNLLWARVSERGLPTTSVSITVNKVFTADGGIDAGIFGDWPQLQDDDLLQNKSRFQIKTGTFEPWKPAVINNELFAKRDRNLSGLAEGVRKALQDGMRYILVCYGTDMTTEQRSIAKQNIQNAFRDCGYADALVEVWGQSELIGLLRSYPSICLQVAGQEHSGIRSRASWSRDNDMSTAVHYSTDQVDLLNEAVRNLASGSIRHLRIVGEPGLGKTRLALEITSHCKLAPITLYASSGSEILKSTFLSQMLREDDHRCALLVVDECGARESAELWNRLIRIGDRIRLVTIDQEEGPQKGEGFQLLTWKKCEQPQIVDILSEYGIAEIEASRWAEFCTGSPRVAHVLGENLKNNQEDLLATSPTSDVWERFIVGPDSPGLQSVETRRRVLSFLSLYEKFGFNEPVSDEGRFISEQAGVKWEEFVECVNDLRHRKILQGDTTLFITPRLLQVYLLTTFWNSRAGTFPILDSVKQMPGNLLRWFIRMLPYIPTNRVTERRIQDLLESYVSGDRFADTKQTGYVLMHLAEAIPHATMRVLSSTFRCLSQKDKFNIKECRQQLVWALQRIAVWRDCFEDAAETLLDLAVAENASNSNNATGTFAELMGIHPAMCATEANLEARINVLRRGLASASPERRQISMRACAHAMNIRNASRIIGAEHQGIRRPEIWRPETRSDLWDSLRDIWKCMSDYHFSAQGEERTNASIAMIQACETMLQNPQLAPFAIQKISELANCPMTHQRRLLNLTHWQLNYGEKRDKYSMDILGSVDAKFRSGGYLMRLNRFVRYSEYEDFVDESFQRLPKMEGEITRLAVESLGDHHSEFVNNLHWLVRSNKSSHFAVALGENDPSRKILDDIIDAATESGAEVALSFLGSYLCGLRKCNAAEWEELVLVLSNDHRLKACFCDWVVNAGMTDKIVDALIVWCAQSTLHADRMERFSDAIRRENVTQSQWEQLITVLNDAGTSTAWQAAIKMFHSYIRRGKYRTTMLSKNGFGILTNPVMSEGVICHDIARLWSDLAEEFCKRYPKRRWELFQQVVSLSRLNSSVLADLDRTPSQVLTSIFQRDPRKAFQIITRDIEENGLQGSYCVRSWLCHGAIPDFEDKVVGPIQIVPIETINEWVEKDVESYGYWIATTMPKTFDSSENGRMTRDFVARFGTHESVRDGIRHRFSQRAWMGNASDMLRRLIDEAKLWRKGEDNRVVNEWLAEYINDLECQLELELQREERIY